MLSFYLFISSVCPSGFAPFGGRCLKVLEDTYDTYQSAKDACAAENSKPASLPEPDVYFFAITLNDK